MSEPSNEAIDMSSEGTTPKEAQKPLTPEAQRALAEAEARREANKNADAQSKATAPEELGGRKGPDPVRFGDWENGGIISDF